MGLSLPIAALAGYMLFSPPADATALYLFVWAALLTIGFTGVSLPYSAWGAEMSGDYATRARITGVREGFTLVGTLIAIALPFALGMDNATAWHGLAILGILVAVGLVAFGAISIWFLPEPKEYSTVQLSLVDGLKSMGGNKAFLRLIFAFFINGLANGIPATLFLYFVSSVIGDESLRGPLLFLYFLCGILGVPLALWAARRTSKHRAWCYARVAVCLEFSTAPLLGQGDVWLFTLICISNGICLGFDIVLPAAIQADVIDADTAQSGEQRSGTYFAAWSLATKLSLALGVGIAFPVLGAFGFSTSAGAANAPEALFALAIVYAWVPVALKIIAIGLMWNFPLGGAEQAELRKQIEARR